MVQRESSPYEFIRAARASTVYNDSAYMFCPDKTRHRVIISENLHDMTIEIHYRGESMILGHEELMEEFVTIRDTERAVRIMAQVFVGIVNRSRMILRR